MIVVEVVAAAAVVVEAVVVEAVVVFTGVPVAFSSSSYRYMYSIDLFSMLRYRSYEAETR